MSEPSPIVGFQCRCGHRTVYVRAAAMEMFARPGETIHDVRLRMRCRTCGEQAPNGPFPFNSSGESNFWCCMDKSIGLKFEREEP